MKISSEAIANQIVFTAINASSGALGAYCFTSINPVGGAIFGAAFQASTIPLATVLNEVFGNTTSEKIVKFATVFFGSIFAAKAVASLFGYAFTFNAGLCLYTAMIPASIIPAIGLIYFLNAAEA